MEDAAVDGSHVRALKGRLTLDLRRSTAAAGAASTNRPARHGTPLAVSLTSGNRHDATPLMPLLDAIPRIRGLVGRTRHRPRRLFTDRSYDYDKYRRLLRARGITPRIAQDHRPRIQPRQNQVGRRTHLRLAPPVSTPAGPLRDTS